MSLGIEGGCHCGSVRYAICAVPRRHSICCCADCRRASGAPMVGWAVVPECSLTVFGDVASYNSSGDVWREFCPRCGTGLFYRSQTLFPGEVDVRSCTFDNPDAFPPSEVIQTDDGPSWLATVATLPHHRRFPPSMVEPEPRD